MRKPTTLLIALAAATALSNCKKQPAAEPADPLPLEQEAAFLKDIDVAAAAKLVEMSDPPMIIDVRTPAEFATGHIDGALNIDFKDPGFKDALDKLERDQSYLIHCQSGGRSGISKAVFTDLGFEAIYHLDGGMSAWVEAGLPTAK